MRAPPEAATTTSGISPLHRRLRQPVEALPHHRAHRPAHEVEVQHPQSATGGRRSRRARPGRPRSARSRAAPRRPAPGRAAGRRTPAGRPGRSSSPMKLHGAFVGELGHSGAARQRIVIAAVRAHRRDRSSSPSARRALHFLQRSPSLGRRGRGLLPGDLYGYVLSHATCGTRWRRCARRSRSCSTWPPPPRPPGPRWARSRDHRPDRGTPG